MEDLSDQNTMSFIQTAKHQEALDFYQDVLGLPMTDDLGHAFVFRAHNTELLLTKVKKFKPTNFTVFGWKVNDLEMIIKQLVEAGVKFIQFDHLKQNSNGVWQAPNGSKFAWFKDPDGNVLSIVQI